MKGLSGRPQALLVGSLLFAIGAALTACGGSTETTTVTTTVKKAAHRPNRPCCATTTGSPRGRRLFDIRHFDRDAPKELQLVVECLTDSGFAPSRRPANRDFAYAGFRHVNVTLETRSGGYEIVIFPVPHEAFAYAYQQTSLPGASGIAVHASYEGRVSFVSTARGPKGVATRGDESHAYYAERTAIAACAFSIPAAKGQPTYVY